MGTVTEYLPITEFDLADPKSYYEVEVTDKGVTVYSECCADTMSRDTALRLYHAIGDYLMATREHHD